MNRYWFSILAAICFLVLINFFSNGSIKNRHLDINWNSITVSGFGFGTTRQEILSKIGPPDSDRTYDDGSEEATWENEDLILSKKGRMLELIGPTLEYKMQKIASGSGLSYTDPEQLSKRNPSRLGVIESFLGNKESETNGEVASFREPTSINSQNRQLKVSYSYKPEILSHVSSARIVCFNLTWLIKGNQKSW